MSWPWAPYLGEEGLKTGSARRSRPGSAIRANVVPHVSKATGVYLNSMLAVTEAPNAGYDEAILLTPDGTVADGPGENIFVVKRRRDLHARPRRPGSCTGSRATRSRRSRRTSATRCVEKSLIRSDLYLADEVFMCGTAAEVTPLRSVDDHEIGVGDGHARAPAGLSRHRARRERPLVRSGASTSAHARPGAQRA